MEEEKILPMRIGLKFFLLPGAGDGQLVALEDPDQLIWNFLRHIYGNGWALQLSGLRRGIHSSRHIFPLLAGIIF